MLSLFNFFLSAIIGAFIGRFIAFVVKKLPSILLDDEEEEMEPMDLFPLFLKESPRAYFFELGFALLFGLTIAFYGLTLPVLLTLLATTILIACFITDFTHQILPDQFTQLLLWIGLTASLIPIFQKSEEAILGAIAGYGFFAFTNALYRYFRGFEGMFPGDFKLNAAIGAILGVKWLVPITLTAFTALILMTLALFILRRGKMDRSVLKEEAPYGCYSSVITIFILYYNLSGALS